MSKKLSEVEAKAGSGVGLPSLMTVDEIAAELRSTRRFVEMMIADGRLPASRIGARMIRVRREDFEALLTPITSSANAR